MIKAALTAGKGALDEWESKSLFAAYGIPVPKGALVKGEAEAIAAAAGIGGKVVMKGVASQIHHKTEAGLVVLGVDAADAEAVARTYRLLEERAAGALEAVLVEQMIESNRELMVGMKRDSSFGPVVAFGLGGVLTEALGDVALALAPLDDRDAQELPSLIKAKRLLGSFRGYPPLDRAALAKILEAIGQIALDHPEIVEIDVNPLMVEETGGCRRAHHPPIGPWPSRRERVRPQHQGPGGSAFDGGSRAFGDTNGRVGLRSILDGGFGGTIYPVNPKGGDFFGLKGYASIEELPEAPDLALLAVGGHQIIPMLEQCSRKGIPAAIAIAAGFSETGDSGAEAEREIARVATEGGVTLMGPNCMGHLQRGQPARGGFRHPPSAQGDPELHLPVGEHRDPDHRCVRAAGHRYRQDVERGQRGADRRDRRFRLSPR
jgi:predicted CoA-binding protein